MQRKMPSLHHQRPGYDSGCDFKVSIFHSIPFTCVLMSLVIYSPCLRHIQARKKMLCQPHLPRGLQAWVAFERRPALTASMIHRMWPHPEAPRFSHRPGGNPNPLIRPLQVLLLLQRQKGLAGQLQHRFLSAYSKETLAVPGISYIYVWMVDFTPILHPSWIPGCKGHSQLSVYLGRNL